MKEREIDIPVRETVLKGTLHIPEKTKGLVFFSHGSGSSRLSPRNRFVAEKLQQKGFATLLFDLLTAEEDIDYQRRFDIELLTLRLSLVTQWFRNQEVYENWNIGYFGASTGAASALKASNLLGPEIIKAVVSRGGRPDLANDALPTVKSPTLLLVGGLDTEVIELNQMAYNKLTCVKKLMIIPGASHLFEEAGKLEEVTEHAENWFLKYLFHRPTEVEKDFLG
ncbi:MAG: dienelactone hydrolase family protein [Balneolaceae bacterium]|jgi:pimeloyl-ACP methyl ester carboxylesterase